MSKISTGRHSPWLMMTLSLCLLMAGCQSMTTTKAITVAGSKGIESEFCSTKVPNSSPAYPNTLYQAMNECVSAGVFDNAVFFYALAGSYTWYDAMRVNTQYARSIHGRLLKESINQLDDVQKNILWEQIQKGMKDPHKKSALCRKVKGIGAPDYQPGYMLINPSEPDSHAFSASVNWTEAVNSYMECPK